MKYILLTILFFIFDYSSCYNINKINLFNNLSRRKSLCYLPIIYLPQFAFAENEKNINELREEANRIIEIIEAQKSSIDLPKLNNKNINNNNDNDNDNDNNENNNNNNNDNIDIEIINILDNKIKTLLNTFKNNDPIYSLNYLKNICSPSNNLKYKDTNKLKIIFDESKYAILLGKFVNFEIINHHKYIDNDDKDFVSYDIDIKVFSDYNTMIYNGIQFKDMYYPNENNNEKLCYVIYRWNFVKSNINNNYELESCYLLPK